MDLGSILFIAAILIIVAMFIGRPFLGYSTGIASDLERQMSTLMAEYDRSIDALQELDFDHELGKIPLSDYPVHRKPLMERGVELLKNIDAIREQLGQVSPGVMDETRAGAIRDDSSLDDDEHIIDTIDDPLEKLIIARRQASQSKADGFCTGCGQPIQKTDQFCPKCGHSLVS